MPIRLLFLLSLRNLWKQRRRNGMMVLALVVAIAGVFSLNTMARGMGIDAMDLLVNRFTGHLKVLAHQYTDDPGLQHSFDVQKEAVGPEELLQSLGQATRIVIPAVIRSERETRGVQLLGIDPANEHISLYDDLEFEGEPLVNAADSHMVIGAALAAELKTAVGRRIVVIATKEDGTANEIGYRISGVYRSNPPSVERMYAFTGLASLQELFGTGHVTEYSIRLAEDSDHLLTKNQTLVKSRFPGLTTLTWREMDPIGAEIQNYMRFSLWLLLIVILCTLVFGLVNTYVTAVLERVREFGMLRALGMKKRAVVAQVVVESVLMMVISLVIGIGIGLLIFWWLSDGITFSADISGAFDLMGMRPQITPAVELRDVQTIVLFSLGLSLVASYFPARRAMKFELLDSLRGTH